MRSAFCWMLLTSLMAADPMIGDQVRVITNDGRDMVGILLSSPSADPLRLRVRQSGLQADVIIPADLVVVSSEELSTSQRRLQEIAEESRLQGNRASAEQHWLWARETKSLGDRIAWRRHLRAIIAQDPNNENAHRALGHVRFENQWVSQADAMRAMGYVRYDGAWMTPEQVAAREEQGRQRREAAELARLERRERAAERRALRTRYQPQTSIFIGSGWLYPRWPFLVGCGPSWGNPRPTPYRPGIR